MIDEATVVWVVVGVRRGDRAFVTDVAGGFTIFSVSFMAPVVK